MTFITEAIYVYFYNERSFRFPNMALEKKKVIKDWGKETLVLLKKIGYIENDYTGRIEIELNLTQGGLGDIRIKQEIRIFRE